MKKKIVSLLLAVLMIAGCFATVTTPASARSQDYFEGENVEIQLYGLYSAVPSSGNIRNVVLYGDRTGSAAITSFENDEEYCYMQVDCISYGEITYVYEQYDEETAEWDWDSDCFTIHPVLLAGQERTIHIYDCVLSSATVEYNIWNIQSNDNTYVTVTDVSVVAEDDIAVTVIAKRAGETEIVCDFCDETGVEHSWLSMSLYNVCVKNPTKYLTSDSSSVALEQDYQLDVNQTYVNTTRLKLDWELDEINASYTSTKTWNAIELKWDEVKSEADAATAGAEFKITNYSSEKISASVSFATVNDENIAATLSSANYENNGLEIDSMVNDDYTIDEDKKANAPSNTITAELEFDAEKFYELAATEENEKYGTYTVTIELGKKITFKICTVFGNDVEITSEETVTLFGNTWKEGIENNDGAFTMTADVNYGYYRGTGYSVGLRVWGKSFMGQDLAVISLYNSPIGFIITKDLTDGFSASEMGRNASNYDFEYFVTDETPLRSGTYYIYVNI